MSDASFLGTERRPLISTRKVVHISMLSFAFLLPFLTWEEAAGAALLALAFNLFILPRLGLNLGKRTAVKAGILDAEYWTGILAYPISVLALILFFGRRMEVVAAVWAIMALGDGSASVVGTSWQGATLAWNRKKTWPGFLAFIAVGTLGSFALARWAAPSLPSLQTLILCLATAIVGAVVESIPIGLDDNFSVPLVCGGFMYCAGLIQWSAVESNLPYLWRRVLLAIAINGALALVALGLRTVNRSGAAVGFLLGVMIYMGYGYKSFLILLAFFLLGSVATRLGYAKKSKRGAAEGRGGARSWREASANTLAGAFFAILVISTHYEAAFLVALVASFAEATGDTLSSEIGKWLSGRAYLITTLKPVPAGEDGGISIPGSLAGLTGIISIVLLGYGLGLCRLQTAAIALAAGIVGNILDSIMGAALERRRLVNNGVINFVGSSVAGGLALGLLLSLHMV